MKQIKVELQETMGSDRSIADSAWTSSMTYQKKKERSDEDVERVVKMLAENKHATPFESVIFKFWIKMPIVIDRQHQTHRIASNNGMSGRYRTMPSEHFLIPQDVEDIALKELGDERSDYYLNKYHELCVEANRTYNEFLKELKGKTAISNKEYKRAREFYRGVLPQNNMTERVTVINLRSFANYQKMRNSPEAQVEIKEVAQLMLDAVKAANICPIAIEWLEKNGWEL